MIDSGETAPARHRRSNATLSQVKGLGRDADLKSIMGCTGGATVQGGTWVGISQVIGAEAQEYQGIVVPLFFYTGDSHIFL